MARYTNIKCGNCGHSFTGGYLPGYQSLLGVSKVKCPKCSNINNTLSKPYSQFNTIDHFNFWVGRIIRMLILGIIYGGLLGLGLNFLFDSSSDSNILGGIFIGIVGNVIFNYFKIKYEINEIEREEADFETPEMEKVRHKRSAINKLNRVKNLSKKITETFPKYDPSKSYNPFESEEAWKNYSELSQYLNEHTNDFQILTWPTDRQRLDESGKIYFEDIALYIKVTDRNRFIKDKLKFNGPVYIKEDVVFDHEGKVLLWGYFEDSKTEEYLQQAKDNLIRGFPGTPGIRPLPNTSYFVIK